MNLDDLKQSVSQLSDDELINLIRDIRSTRRIPAAKQKAVSATKAAKPVVSQDLSTAMLLASLSKDQVAQLLTELDKKGK